MIRILVASAIAFAVTPTTAALADEVTGILLAHDRKAHVVVLRNREAYEYDPETTELPDELLAGSRIRITYRGGEDGIESVSAIEVVEPPAEGEGNDTAGGDTAGGNPSDGEGEGDSDG